MRVMPETRLNMTATGANATSHTPLALSMTVTISVDCAGEWAGLVIETTTPRPVIVALKD